MLSGIITTPDDTCSFNGSDGVERRITLHTDTDTTSILQNWKGDSLCSEWPIDAKVWKLQCADITGNGIPEIAVGVIRKSRYAQYESRRLWLFTLYDEEDIRPLWLSSRMSHNLLDFNLEPSSTLAPFFEQTDEADCPNLPPYIIYTREQTTRGDTIQMYYQQRGFGLRGISLPRLRENP